MAIDSVISTMRASLQTALDDIASPRVSANAKLKALQIVERNLAEACFNTANDSEAKECFVALQYTFECNVASRLLAWITMTTVKLDSITSKGPMDNDQSQEAESLSSLLALALSLIQGTVLNHPSTKEYLGRRSALEILLDLLLTSRHLGENTDPKAKSPKDNPHLISIVLDTLLCVLVDSPSALRAFEQAHGVQAIVKILKRAGTPREVRMKCLEFIYFYLLDETPSQPALTLTPVTPPATLSRAPHYAPTAPNTPVLAPTAPATPMKPPKPYFGATPSGPLRPTSRYGSSTFSFSASQKKLSVSTSTSSLSSPSSRSSSGSSSNQSFCSTSSNASSGTDASSVPASSPVKEASFAASQSAGHIPSSHAHAPPPLPPLPRSPTKRVATPANLGYRAHTPTFTPFSSAAKFPQMQVQARPMALLRRDVEYVPESPKKATTTAAGTTTPTSGALRDMPGGGLHKRSLSSMSSSGSVAGRMSHSRSRSQITLSEAAEAGNRSAVAMSGDGVLPMPMPRDALDRIRALQQQQRPSGRSREVWRTTEEKKELLGTMLGNVDALVEGVRKAGVWGLA